MDTGFVRQGSVQHEVLETGDLQSDTERERERGGGETHKTERKPWHTDNPSENIKRREGEVIEMVVGVEEVWNCSVDHVCAHGSMRTDCN